MQPSQIKVIVIFLILILICGLIIGSIEEGQNSENKDILPPELTLDQPTILPDWKDGEYHDYKKTMLELEYFNETYPDLVDVFSIGNSIQEREIRCIRITNENNNSNKYTCLINGCLHGNEWEGGESCLYFADFLLINYDTNETVKHILNTSEIYIVPLVNPDGRQADTRWNHDGIDLNRNFAVHFGRLRSLNYPLGKLFGVIKFPYIYHPLKKTYSSNCGKYPFSEPESKAISDFMKSLDRYSFYFDCHTATHYFGAPGNITYEPEFIVTDRERKILDYVLDWINDSTEYETIPGEEFRYPGIGCAMDWVYYEYNIPSFCLELLNNISWLGLRPGEHDHLVHWMKTALPVFMYLVVNIENLYHWEIPDIQPSLPEGIPPDPI